MPQQVRPPARVVRIGLMSGDCFHLLRVCQHDAQWKFRIVLQNIQHRLPVTAGTLHHHMRAAGALEPLAQRFQLGADRSEFTNLFVGRFICRARGHTHARDFLPTSMPAHRSITAGIITFSCSRLRRAGVYPYKLLCERKLIPGCALRRPARFILGACASITLNSRLPQPRHDYAPVFMFQGGRQAMRVYPLLPSETCWLLAADFDKATWEYDSLAFLETCQELKVPAALERSRSGKGGHIWIFFDRALPAITARKLGCVRCLRGPWSVGIRSAWIPTIASFPTRTRCRRGDLGPDCTSLIANAPQAGQQRIYCLRFQTLP